MTRAIAPDLPPDFAPDWLALMIGNSRLHWAWFSEHQLVQCWDTPHLSAEAIASVWSNPALIQPSIHDSLEPIGSRESISQDSHLILPPHLDLWMASVVPHQTSLWQPYPKVQVITLAHIPLSGCYSTLGVDRALAAVGAIQQWGTPVLVIDGGTALTLTGIDPAGHLVGGAILPGLNLQGRSLHTQTAKLPKIQIDLDAGLPNRWATDTTEAVQSGILYTTLAGIQDFILDWWKTLGQECLVIFTGGEGPLLIHQTQTQRPDWAMHLRLDPFLIAHGFQVTRNQYLTTLQVSRPH
jgi:type III pantothenate kinase